MRLALLKAKQMTASRLLATTVGDSVMPLSRHLSWEEPVRGIRLTSLHCPSSLSVSLVFPLPIETCVFMCSYFRSRRENNWIWMCFMGKEKWSQTIPSHIKLAQEMGTWEGSLEASVDTGTFVVLICWVVRKEKCCLIRRCLLYLSHPWVSVWSNSYYIINEVKMVQPYENTL